MKHWKERGVIRIAADGSGDFTSLDLALAAMANKYGNMLIPVQLDDTFFTPDGTELSGELSGDSHTTSGKDS